MTTTALVPVQRLDHAKSRLAGRLAPEARRALVLRLLGHVLDTVAAVTAIDAALVVTPDPEVAAAAERHGAAPLYEPGGDLNVAIRIGRDAARSRGASRLLILFGDLPLLTVADVTGLLALAREHQVVVAPDRHGAGTNALALSPPDVIEPAFGPASLAAHRAAARRRRVAIGEYRALGTGFDLDTALDLDELERSVLERDTDVARAILALARGVDKGR